MKFFVDRKSCDAFCSNLQRRNISTLSSNSQSFIEIKILFLTLESLRFKFFYCVFLFYSVHRRCAHIHTNCARPHEHKQTPIHIGTSTHNCTNAPPHGMHSHLRAHRVASVRAPLSHLQPLYTHILVRSHSHAFTRTHTRVHSHSQALNKHGLIHSVTLFRTQSHLH